MSHSTRSALTGLFLTCTAPLIAEQSSSESRIPIVAAARVERGEMVQQASFEAEFRPYQEIELHARISGYMDKITVDIGDLVKEGQQIANLDVPELKGDLDHAEAAIRRGKAEIARAQASYEDAHLTLGRIASADKARPNLIAQQDIDTATAKDRAAEAAVDAAKEQVSVAEADLRKLQIMETYTRIVAPFAGVVTKRYCDPGALIQAGTNTGSLPLVRLSENDRLRAVFPLSISFASRVKLGDPVEIRVPSINRTIAGKVARFSRKIETATRTMDVEVDVPNPDLSLIPGNYGIAALTTDHHENTLTVPVEAVARNSSGEAKMLVVTKDHKVEERKVKIGLESPNRIELLSGAEEGEIVMVSNGAQVKSGDIVEALIPATAKTVSVNSASQPPAVRAN